MFIPIWLISLSISGFVGLAIFLAERNISTGFKMLDVGYKLGVKEEKARQKEKMKKYISSSRL